MELRVLYEDNHLLAVYKPSGVLVQGDSGGERCLLDDVKDYLKEKYRKPGNVFVGLLHRLDRPVAGVILFAKTSKGASRLSEQFRAHTIQKIYQALVVGMPSKPTGTLVNYLKKDEAKNKTTAYDMEYPGALYAELSYRLVEQRGDRALLEITLETGRPHQIRSQLAHIGHPIVGDLKYGAPEALPDKSIALAAVRLTFKLATTDDCKTVEIPAPF